MPVSVESNGARGYCFVIALLILIFALGNYVLPLSKTAVHWWADLAWTLMSAVAAWRCFRAASALQDHEAKAWRLFGWGCLAWFLGMLYWDFRELVMGQVTPFPEISDIGFLALAPLFAAGLLYYYRGEAPTVSFTIMEISQLGIIFACIIAAHVVILYGPLSREDLSVLYRLAAVAYPVLYMGLLVQAIYSLWMHAGATLRHPLILLVLGIAVYAVTNSFYAYSLLGRSYEAGHYIDIGWVVGFALIFSAAEERWRTRARHSAPVADYAVLPRPLRLGGLLPAVVLLITLLVVMTFRDRLQPGVIDLLEPVAILLVVFLALREWASNALRGQLAAAERASEEKVRQLADVVPVGILRLDLRGGCHYANQYCGEITGLSPEQHLGRGWIEALHPEDRERVWREDSSAKTATMGFSSEFRFVRPDGKTVWVMGQVTAERDDDGKVSGYIGSLTDITMHRESEQALRESERRFKQAFASIPVMASISRLNDGFICNVNEAFMAVTGYSRDEAVGRTDEELGLWVSADDRAAIVKTLRQSGSVTGRDWQVRIKSGDIRDVFGSFEVVQLGNEQCLLMIAQDVTARRQAEAHMKKLSSALEQTADAVMITNRDGIIEYVNSAFIATTGFAMEEVLGKRPNIINSGKQGVEFYRKFWSTILAGEVYNDVFINKRKDGSLYYEEKTVTPLKDDDGAITHFISTGHDITARMQTQERLQFLAHHDVLTGLPNRSLFMDRLKQALAYARWNKRLVAVLFFDIDRFKNINDTLGHEVGDQLLQLIAQRLEGCLRERDTVARFGGDEFVVVLNDIATSADVGSLAKKILAAMRPPFVINNVTLHIAGSIGISLFPGDGEESGTLLSKADTAMYRAKDMGRNHYQFYSVEMGVRAFERFAMENKLRLALERNEFVLHYQPQIDARSGRIIGTEALLRWQHPDFGLVPPLEFIPLLEETGLIIPVGEWVLRAACGQLAEWRKSGWEQLRMAVNLSSIQFGNPGLLPVITKMLANLGLAAHRLELEITESVLMHRDKTTASLLSTLDEMGVRLGLDDFGTGYSSLSYLRRFPIDTLKIDRSFVRDIPDDPEDTAITRAIISMAQSLKLELIAEGVENRVQADFLQSLGCHVLQGFFFSRPLPAEEMTQLLVSRGGVLKCE